MKTLILIVVAILAIIGMVFVGAILFVALTLWVEKHPDEFDDYDDIIDIDE